MLFLWALGLLSLALTWGGGTYSWNSPAVLAPLIIGSVLSIGWLLRILHVTGLLDVTHLPSPAGHDALEVAFAA